jgi:hypothetical protein
MENIIGDVREWFLPRKEYFDAFIKNDTRVESWYKAELLVLLSRLVKERAVDSFEREPSFYDKEGKRSQIDFSVTIKGVEHYLELKALCISQSKGTPRNLSFYFRDDNVGLIKDFKKLDAIGIRNKWILAFIYPKPDTENWRLTTNKVDNWELPELPRFSIIGTAKMRVKRSSIV